MKREAKQLALDYIGRRHVVTLATYGDDGVWAAAVFYVSHQFDLFFLSAAHTRHVRHFTANPRIAATIQRDYDSWEAIKGIQLEGTVAELSGAERDDAIALYLARFPFLSLAGEPADALQFIAWYRLRPDLVFFIDNSQGLGHRDRVL